VGSWITRNLAQQVDLLKRHAEILDALVKAERPLGIIKLSKITGHSPHLVRYSLRELENADVVRPSARGSNLTPQAKSFLANLNKEIGNIQTDLQDFSSKLSTIQKKS
jgi:predicted transcriptional regulator